MLEPNEADQVKPAAEDKWADFNRDMRSLFAERDKHPVDSAGREAAARKIFDLWLSADH